MGEWTFTDKAEFCHDWQVEVAGEVMMLGGALLGTDSPFQLLSDREVHFMDGFREKHAEGAEKDEEQEVQKEGEEPVWASLPWLLEHYPAGVEAVAQPRLAREKQAPDRAAGAQDLPSVEGMTFVEAFEALEERRQAWADAGDVDLVFQLSIRGGKWCADHTGEAFDSARGMASKGLATQFCLRHGLVSSATFSFKLYSEAMAVALSRCWCHKHQWLLDQWLLHEGGAGLFSDEMLSRYVEPPEAAELQASDSVHVQRRFAGIRALRPLAPPSEGA